MAKKKKFKTLKEAQEDRVKKGSGGVVKEEVEESVKDRDDE